MHLSLKHMAKKTLQVNINEPCHEDWNKMDPTKCGAFCKACNKEVIDFTNKSEAEIIDILSKVTGKVCGRFTEDKLNKPLTKYTPDLEWYSWRKWAVAAGVLLGVGNLSANTNNKNADTGHFPADTIVRKGTPLVHPPMLGIIAIMPIDTPMLTTSSEIVTKDTSGILIGDTVIVKSDTLNVPNPPDIEKMWMGEPSIIMGKIAAPDKMCKPKK